MLGIVCSEVSWRCTKSFELRDTERERERERIVQLIDMYSLLSYICRKKKEVHTVFYGKAKVIVLG